MTALMYHLRAGGLLVVDTGELMSMLEAGWLIVVWALALAWLVLAMNHTAPMRSRHPRPPLQVTTQRRDEAA